MLSNNEDFIDVYLKRLEEEAQEQGLKQESIQQIGLSMTN
jgi:hypothetical protein